MSETLSGSILVVAESMEETRDRLTGELVAAAQAIFGKDSREIDIVVLGDDAENRAAAFADMAGVRTVLHGNSGALDPFTAVPWVQAVSLAVEATNPTLILVSASLAGRDIGPRLAARLGARIVSDVVAVDASPGGVSCTRQVQGGRLVSQVELSGPRAVVTVRPGSVREAPAAGGSAGIRELDLSGLATAAGLTVIETVVAEKTAEGIATADRIVSGGRGLGKPENFALVEELADVLNAAVGASGAVVGAGWRPHSQQVGSTGTTVAPRLYLAVGISGAVQHTIGMSGADTIVAINRDPEAPIFTIASLGVVGDLFEIVPALIAELKSQE